MTSTTLEPRRGAGRPARARLSLGGRRVEGGAAAARRLVRLDGRHADVGARLGRYVGAFLAAWPPRDGAGDGADPAVVAARDAAGVAAAAMRVVARQPATGALQLNAGGYGFGLGVSQTCAFRARSSRTAAACPGSARSCAGCRSTASASSRSATSPTPAGARTDDAAFDRAGEDRRAAAARPSRRRRWSRARDAVSRLVMQVGRRARRQDRGREPVPRSIARTAARPRSRRCAPRSAPARAGDGFDVVENALRGQWTMSCERGKRAGVRSRSRRRCRRACSPLLFVRAPWRRRRGRAVARTLGIRCVHRDVFTTEHAESAEGFTSSPPLRPLRALKRSGCLPSIHRRSDQFFVHTFL